MERKSVLKLPTMYTDNANLKPSEFCEQHGRVEAQRAAIKSTFGTKVKTTKSDTLNSL